MKWWWGYPSVICTFTTIKRISRKLRKFSLIWSNIENNGSFTLWHLISINFHWIKFIPKNSLTKSSSKSQRKFLKLWLIKDFNFWENLWNWSKMICLIEKVKNKVTFSYKMVTILGSISSDQQKIITLFLTNLINFFNLEGCGSSDPKKYVVVQTSSMFRIIWNKSKTSNHIWFPITSLQS